MLAAKRLAGITPEVNLMEHISCKPPPSVNKAAHSGFETQRRCHQKSETVAPKKTYVLTKKFKKYGRAVWEDQTNSPKLPCWRGD